MASGRSVHAPCHVSVILLALWAAALVLPSAALALSQQPGASSLPRALLQVGVDKPTDNLGSSSGSSSRQDGAAPATGAARGSSSVTSGSCPDYIDTKKYRRTNFTDFLNTTVSIHPKRPPADVPTGDWIQGRATFYGADDKLEASRVVCGEPAGQFGVIEQGSCGYTNSDGSLPFPREMYAAVADTNEDYPGSCGRCYQVRCKTGSVFNNGRPLLISDLIYGRPYRVKDSSGRDWPGNPKETEDLVWAQCWDDSKVITVRVGDSCPCQYPIKTTGEIRTQNWCCGGNNHFDLSFWAFEQLAHPSYGVIPIEYQPVNCDSGTPCGFISQVIFSDSIQPGWNWLPYNSKNAVLSAKGQGVSGSVATCATLSEEGAVKFLCRQCSRPGYQPFAKSDSLQFDIRSNTKSGDAFASSTPRGALPGLKLFMMNSDNETYCGAEVSLSSNPQNATLADGAQYAQKQSDDWFRVIIPLTAFACQNGSVGSLAAVDRVDFQNIDVRDADICLDNIQLV